MNLCGIGGGIRGWGKFFGIVFGGTGMGYRGFVRVGF